MNKLLLDELSRYIGYYTGYYRVEEAVCNKWVGLILFENVEVNVVKVIFVFCFDGEIVALRVAKGAEWDGLMGYNKKPLQLLRDMREMIVCLVGAQYYVAKEETIFVP